MGLERWTWRHGILKNQIEMETKAIFLNPFTVWSSCKWKFVICPFLDKETNGSYPLANGHNGLAHLCLLVKDLFLFLRSQKALGFCM
jgi:hypothetical protein